MYRSDERAGIHQFIQYEAARVTLGSDTVAGHEHADYGGEESPEIADGIPRLKMS